jgi:hypothetical protein
MPHEPPQSGFLQGDQFHLYMFRMLEKRNTELSLCPHS